MMSCPVCKQSAIREGNTFWPFCSERCKLIDLDNWLEGRYRVPSVTGEADDDPAQDGIPNPKVERE